MAGATDRMLLEPSIVTWCDRHLMAMNTLAVLVSDQPGPAATALAETLEHSHQPGRRSPSRNLFGDRCPEHTTAVERVEVALSLLGPHTGAGIAITYGLPEPAVLIRLHRALVALAAPCDRSTAPE
jgi:hypothetical protein